MTPPLPTSAPDRATRPRTGVGFAADLAQHGGRPALVAGHEVVSYDDLADRVARARARLGSAQRLVGLVPAPTIEFVVAYLAALAGGHAVLLSHDEVLARAYGASTTWADGGFTATGRPDPVLHPDLRLLLSTSGSTGSPKLVRLSRSNIESNAGAIASYLGLTADDRAITTLPLDYCYGLSVLHSHLAVGASLVLTDLSVAESALWDLARATGVTSFAGVPFTFDLLDTAGWPALPTLRQVTQAGGRLAPDRVAAVAERGRREGWDLIVMYGQTEATARMAYLPPDLTDAHPGAIGVAIPGGALHLEPVDGAVGHAAGVGELVYTGPNVMMGYAHGTADLARGAELTELRTGDLARQNDAGLFEVVGRSSRFAKLFGKRIDLDRVENLLTLDDHEVACAESADATRLVVALAGEADRFAIDEAAATAVAATGLPEHAVAVVPVAAVPRLPNGKVDQAAVSRLEAPRADVRALSPVDALTAVYAAVLGRHRVTADDTFTGLGGDSLSYVELSLRLESRLGRLPSDWPDRTIGDLAASAAGARRSRWVRLDTGILLRAAAIVMIVGSHTNLFVLAGGAHVLLAVAGANFARFHLAGAERSERRRNLTRSIARIAVPTALWVAAVLLISGQYGWRNVLLLNDAIGRRTWHEPEWHFWFIEVLVYLLVGAGALTTVARVAAWERRSPYWFAVGLVVAGLVPRFWATASGYDGDLIHSSLFVAWLFAGGWAATRARHAGHRLLLSALLVAGLVGFCDDPVREATIALGLLALVWLPYVPFPRALIGVVGQVAGASLYVYLTHWQVYPHFEHRLPVAGLLASLLVGIAVWRLVDHVSDRGRVLGRRHWHGLGASHPQLDTPSKETR
ncbi:AMP-binding protein [Nocardioides bizhenqiangii]|uniref:AMP-binding protein n=1 Tax=Nocardioides bizhenqiangii TaxID=3095076 RepID=A0ABZ0ZRW3_9ACTN|nr:AMP-binding protein [Nocardioides sp. HM61]WQQ27035.1 AMP-binding protein [Nocardioides sp. HM61]